MAYPSVLRMTVDVKGMDTTYEPWACQIFVSTLWQLSCPRQSPSRLGSCSCSVLFRKLSADFQVTIQSSAKLWTPLIKFWVLGGVVSGTVCLVGASGSINGLGSDLVEVGGFQSISMGHRVLNPLGVVWVRRDFSKLFLPVVVGSRFALTSN